MSRRLNQYLQETHPVVVQHGQLTATTAIKLLKVPYACYIPAGGIKYNNPGGLAVDATNNFKCAVTKTGAVNLLSAAVLFDTDDDGAALAADTHLEPALSAVAGATTLAAGDIITATFTEEGAATLPPGQFELTLVRI